MLALLLQKVDSVDTLDNHLKRVMRTGVVLQDVRIPIGATTGGL